MASAFDPFLTLEWFDTDNSQWPVFSNVSNDAVGELVERSSAVGVEIILNNEPKRSVGERTRWMLMPSPMLSKLSLDVSGGFGLIGRAYPIALNGHSIHQTKHAGLNVRFPPIPAISVVAGFDPKRTLEDHICSSP